MMRNFCHFPTVQTHKLFRMPFFCPTNLHTRQNGSSAISSSSLTIISQNLRSTSIPGNPSSPKHKSLGAPTHVEKMPDASVQQNTMFGICGTLLYTLLYSHESWLFSFFISPRMESLCSCLGAASTPIPDTDSFDIV